jgi:hypothetical protein
MVLVLMAVLLVEMVLLLLMMLMMLMVVVVVVVVKMSSRRRWSKREVLDSPMMLAPMQATVIRMGIPRPWQRASAGTTLMQ